MLPCLCSSFHKDPPTDPHQKHSRNAQPPDAASEWPAAWTSYHRCCKRMGVHRCVLGGVSAGRPWSRTSSGRRRRLSSCCGDAGGGTASCGGWTVCRMSGGLRDGLRIYEKNSLGFISCFLEDHASRAITYLRHAYKTSANSSRRSHDKTVWKKNCFMERETI